MWTYLEFPVKGLERFMRKFVVIAFIVLAGAGYWYFTEREDNTSTSGSAGDRFGDPPLVIAGPVQREKIIETIEAIGTTRANESVTLTAKVSEPCLLYRSFIISWQDAPVPREPWPGNWGIWKRRPDNLLLITL
jgi:hypothetical protein